MRATREQLCEAIHEQLDRLSGYDTRPTAPIPRGGIYFWYEAGEVRQGQGQRVTRVGTHEKEGRLLCRIDKHYAPRHDASVFRKHVGGALMRRNGEPESQIQEWYKAQSSPRAFAQEFGQYEDRVTEEIKRGNYRVLQVNDAVERLELEERLIALFSHCGHCRPSRTWLGNWAQRSQIRQSGLWNVRCVFSENEFRGRDLARLDQLVMKTLAA